MVLFASLLTPLFMTLGGLITAILVNLFKVNL